MKTDKKWLTSWFKKRGLDKRKYQFDVILNKLDSIYKESLPVVLAMCPNSGKTLISIAYIEKYLIDNPKARVLVLTHGQTILRTQYCREIEKINPDFSHRVIESKQDLENSYEQVIVTLPQTISRLKKLPNFDLVIFDEAHHYFLKEMVQNIIKKCKSKHKILLTGSPCEYIKLKYKLFSYSVLELYSDGKCADMTPQLYSSVYNFNKNDYVNDELKEETKIKVKHTKIVLDDVLKTLTNELKTGEKLEKTIIAAANAQMANQIKAYFDKTKYKACLSTAKTDKDSEEIDNFLKDKYCQVLIVLKRGILGFNFPELVNAIDLTMSKNVDRTFQLMLRVLRKHPTGKKKRFIKVAPHKFYNEFWTVMKAVGCMCIKEYYEAWNGKDFVDKEIPVEFDVVHELKKTKNSNGQTKRAVHKALIIDGMPLSEILIKTNNEILNKNLNLRDYISFYKLKNNFKNKLDSHTYEEIKIKFCSCNDKADFRKKFPIEYGYVISKGWLDKLISESGMEITFEKCMTDSLNYEYKKDWKKYSYKFYAFAERKGWIDKCCAHMKKIGYTKEICAMTAKKYETKYDFQKYDRHIYQSAQARGWLNEICKHMVPPSEVKYNFADCKKSLNESKNIIEWILIHNWQYERAIKDRFLLKLFIHKGKKVNYTLEECIKDAKKHTDGSMWLLRSPIICSVAKMNNWLKKCTAHMQTNKKCNARWSFEACELISKSCKYLNEWYLKHKNSYQKSLQKGWFKKLTAHMIIEKKVKQIIYTEKECIESAKPFEYKKYWEKECPEFYRRAIDLDCVKKCIAHMNRHIVISEKECIKNSLTCETKREFMLRFPKHCIVARKGGFLHKCYKHMPKRAARGTVVFSR